MNVKKADFLGESMFLHAGIHKYINFKKNGVTARMNFDRCKKQLMEMLSDFAL